MATKLTERWIERMACPPGKKDMLAFDTEQRGLGVRVVSSGSRTYLAQYTHQGRRHRIALGNADAVTLADARDAARIIMGEVAKGLHPAEDRKSAVAAAKAEAARERVTVGAVVDGWEQLHLSKRRESYRVEAPRALRKGLAAWLTRPAERLAKADVLAVLDASSQSIGRSIAAYGSACFA